MDRTELQSELEALAKKEGKIPKRKKIIRKDVLQNIQKHVDMLGGKSSESRFAESVDIPERKSGNNRIKAMYKSPDGQLWSGRGRRPMWAKELLRKGESLEDYRIKDAMLDVKSSEPRFTESVDIPVRKSSDNRVKAMYKSPDGQLWSGRGRRPLWAMELLRKGESLEDYRIKDAE